MKSEYKFRHYVLKIFQINIKFSWIIALNKGCKWSISRHQGVYSGTIKKIKGQYYHDINLKIYFVNKKTSPAMWQFQKLLKEAKHTKYEIHME